MFESAALTSWCLEKIILTQPNTIEFVLFQLVFCGDQTEVTLKLP